MVADPKRYYGRRFSTPHIESHPQATEETVAPAGDTGVLDDATLVHNIGLSPTSLFKEAKRLREQAEELVSKKKAKMIQSVPNRSQDVIVH